VVVHISLWPKPSLFFGHFEFCEGRGWQRGWLSHHNEPGSQPGAAVPCSNYTLATTQASTGVPVDTVPTRFDHALTMQDAWLRCSRVPVIDINP